MNKLFKMIAAASFLQVASLGNPKFRVVGSIPARMKTVGAGTPDLSRLTVKELRALATAMKIKGRSKARRKADLVKLITSAKGTVR